MANNAHGVIATNSADYNSLRREISTPLAQIPIGSNIKTYTPNHVEIAEVREKLKLTDKDCLLGYFGFLNESKGADTLLHALSLLGEQFHLVFIGGQTGSSDPTNVAYSEQIKTLIKQLGLTRRVHWTGFLPDMRVSTYLTAADMLVMPYQDGASLRRGTLMAVLAHGRPLITTLPSESAPELVDKENVWFVPANNAQALSRAVNRLAVDKESRAALGVQAAETANLFSWGHIARLTVAFFDQLAGVNK
jgi:glycosyltransferase involved in cell wall biosynthesis